MGFTLIELLVVVVIVGILAAVATPTFIGQLRRSRTVEAQVGLSTLSRGSEIYRLEFTTYPNDYLLLDPITTGSTVYLQDPWSTKAPNYSIPSFLNSSQAGVLLETIAFTTSNRYVNASGNSIKCQLGLGDQVGAEGIFDIDKGCNVYF